MVEQSVQRRDISSNLSKEWKKDRIVLKSWNTKKVELERREFQHPSPKESRFGGTFFDLPSGSFQTSAFWERKEDYQGLQSKGMPTRHWALRFETKTLSWLIQKNDKWTITMSYVQSNTVRDFNISTVPEFQAHLLSHNQPTILKKQMLDGRP